MSQIKNAVSVQNGAKFKIELLQLKTLSIMGSPGVNGIEPAIDSASGFLQRLAQQLMWRYLENARSKSYLRSLVMGNALLDSFVVVPAELLKKSVTVNAKQSNEEQKEAWDIVLKYINERIENGAEFFIIDGQNRLNEALVPFFKNKIPFDTKEGLLITDTKGDVHDIRGKFYRDLPLDIKKYINNIEVPFVKAISGDIEKFSETLVWKNEGIAWDDWQKTLMNQWYTKFRRQISSIASKDDETGDTPSIAILDKVSGAKYSYDVNGFDRLVAELLVWMDCKNQPTNPKEYNKYFSGGETVLDSSVTSLKTYLKELSLTYKDIKSITHTELRNYVMLRFVLENPSKFKTQNFVIPNWKIMASVDFASWYKVINKVLMKKPESLCELPSTKVYKSADGTETSSKNPGSYNWYNSESGKDFLLNRVAILLRVLTGKNIEHMGASIYSKLINEGVVVEMDTEPMPSYEEVYLKDSNDTDGKSIPISKLNSKYVNLGHNIAKSKGGSNKDITLQRPRGNRQWQEDFVGK